MTKEIQLPSGGYLLVEVPQTSTPIYQYSLIAIKEAGLSWLHYLDEYENDVARCEELHGNSCQIIGKGNELTENQWEEIIERWDSGRYNDYSRHLARVDTATESGHSLIKSHSMKPEQVLILKATTDKQ